jgi:hypothetical protein
MLTAATGALGLFRVDSENSTDLVAVVAFFLVALVFIVRSIREDIVVPAEGGEDASLDRLPLTCDQDEGGDFL